MPAGSGTTPALLPTSLGLARDLSLVCRKSGTPDLRWGGVGGGGVSAELDQRGADTPTLALPTRGREKALYSAPDTRPALRSTSLPETGKEQPEESPCG